MAININTIKTKKITAIGNRVLVTDMHFGEQKTTSGLIIGNDDGKSRGVYPRWGKVYSKDEYNVGDWILVEHGRWTRGMNVETIEDGEITIRMVEAESVLAYSDEKPSGITIGAEYSDGPVDIDPSSFINP
jgi:co-chaperonin GroES (HSP10)